MFEIHGGAEDIRLSLNDIYSIQNCISCSIDTLKNQAIAYPIMDDLITNKCMELDRIWMQIEHLFEDPLTGQDKLYELIKEK